MVRKYLTTEAMRVGQRNIFSSCSTDREEHYSIYYLDSPCGIYKGSIYTTAKLVQFARGDTLKFPLLSLLSQKIPF